MRRFSADEVLVSHSSAADAVTRRGLPSLGLALVLGACAVPEPGIRFDATAGADMRVIGLLIGEAGGATALVNPSAAGGFGLIGAAIAAAIRAENEKLLGQVLADEKLVPIAVFTVALEQSLREAGYSSFVVPEPPGRVVLRESYPAPEQGVDAWLDIVLTGYGYYNDDLFAPWHPFITARVRLVRTRDGAVLMRQRVYSSRDLVPWPFRAEPDGVVIGDVPEPQFRSFSALSADPVRAAAGLAQVMQGGGEAIAALLHRS